MRPYMSNFQYFRPYHLAIIIIIIFIINYQQNYIFIANKAGGHKEAFKDNKYLTKFIHQKDSSELKRSNSTLSFTQPEWEFSSI